MKGIKTVKAALTAFIAGLFFASAAPALAHHSFAVWDMAKEQEFTGVVETLKFRNPHMAMTLAQTNEDGEKEIIHFSEGAPANMLVRMGLKASMLEPGSKITAIGAPRKDDPDVFFLKRVILEDGREFNVLKAAN